MKRSKYSEKEKIGRGSTTTPMFLGTQPNFGRRSSSGPLILDQSTKKLNTDSFELSDSASTEISPGMFPVTQELSDTSSVPILCTPGTISDNSSLKLLSPIRLPSSTASKLSRKEKAPSLNSHFYDYELPCSPLQTPSSHLRESSLSAPILEGTRESIDALHIAELYRFYLFIFNFSFGDEKTRKKCFADFFTSNMVVDSKIPLPVKQYFYKIILQALNPEAVKAKILDSNSIEAKMLSLKSVEAKMLLNISADERLLPILAETLRYIKEEIPSTKGVDIEAYILSIANGKSSGEFPYGDIEQEKFYFLRYALQQNYNFFEYVFTKKEVKSQITEVITISKVQRWLYSELTYQFILNKDRDIDEIEDKVQEPSKLNVAHIDLLQALYQHLMTLLKGNKQLSFSAARTAFLLVYQLSHEFIYKKKEMELSALFDLLLQPPAGIGLLCAVTDNEKEHSVKKWLNLLESKRSLVLLNKILSIIPHLSTEQIRALLKSTLMNMLTDRLSQRQKLQLLHSFLYLDLLIVDMHICENDELMQIAKKYSLIETLQERIWHSFSLNSLTDTSEKKGAFLKNSHLIASGNSLLSLYASTPLLKCSEVRSYHSIAAGVKISMLKEQWLDAYKTLYSLILKYWLPSNRDLRNISRLKEKWNNVMINKLASNSPYDYDAYNPQHYALNEIPAKMCKALLDRKKALSVYKKQIEIMKTCYKNIIDCVKDRDIQLAQPYPTLVGYISFIELIKTIATEKKLNCTKQQIQVEACAEKVSCWFKEILEINYPDEAVFSNLTKKKFGEPSEKEVFYLSMEYSLQFQELLILKKSPYSLFESPHIILNEKQTKATIEKLLSVIMEQKSTESINIASSSLTIFRRSPITPKVTRMRATPLSLPSP